MYDCFRLTQKSPNSAHLLHLVTVRKSLNEYHKFVKQYSIRRNVVEDNGFMTAIISNLIAFHSQQPPLALGFFTMYQLQVSEQLVTTVLCIPFQQLKT
jgi:hypothetical protein